MFFGSGLRDAGVDRDAITEGRSLDSRLLVGKRDKGEV